jgi:hypothetical protein
VSSTVNDILDDLVSTLRTSGNFKLVTLGEAGSTTVIPRASVLYEGLEVFPADDSASTQWTRLKAKIHIRTRSNDTSEATKRCSELCEEAASDLLDDPYRNEKCKDLPVGRATEVSSAEPRGNLKHPEVEIHLDVRCHFESEEPS